MNRSELCSRLAKECHLSMDEASIVVDEFFNSIAEELVNGSRVEIRGLCSWQLKQYEGYNGRNPNTGDTIAIEPKRLPFFKVGKELVDALNEELLPKLLAEKA